MISQAAFNDIWKTRFLLQLAAFALAVRPLRCLYTTPSSNTASQPGSHLLHRSTAVTLVQWLLQLPPLLRAHWCGSRKDQALAWSHLLPSLSATQVQSRIAGITAAAAAAMGGTRGRC